MNAGDIFVFDAGAYVGAIVVAIASIALVLATATWAFSDDERLDRVGYSGIVFRFFLPITIPILIQFVATAGLLYQCQQSWVTSRISQQTLDTLLAYLLLMLAVAVALPGWIVIRLGFEAVQKARYSTLVSRILGPRGALPPSTPRTEN